MKSMIASQGFELGPTWTFEANCTFFFELISFNERSDTESRPWRRSWDERNLLSSCNESPNTKPRFWWGSWNKWAWFCRTVRHGSFSYQFNFLFSKFWSFQFQFVFYPLEFHFYIPYFPVMVLVSELAHLGIQVISKRLLHIDVPPVSSLGRWLVRIVKIINYGMIEQLSNESRSIIFMKNIRISLERLFFNFGEKF